VSLVQEFEFQQVGNQSLQYFSSQVSSTINFNGYVVDPLDAPAIEALPPPPWLHFPIRDKWIPSGYSFPAYLGLCKQIARNLGHDKNIMIHCNGGYGRTGLTTVCTLLCYFQMHNLPLPTAKSIVSLTRSVRPRTIRNPLQVKLKF